MEDFQQLHVVGRLPKVALQYAVDARLQDDAIVHRYHAHLR